MKRPGVIFDMDGLLLDTERICLEAFVQTRRAFSLPESPEVYLSCVGLHASACSEIIAQSVREKATLKDFNRAWDARSKTPCAGAFLSNRARLMCSKRSAATDTPSRWPHPRA
ncbi:MAG: HAD hydrolase-like protein, partial [Pseudomonadota bacterium]